MASTPRKRNIVDTVEVGKKLVLSDEQTISASFHNFADLPHKPGDYTESPVLQCHGHSWTIKVYPDKESHLSIFLYRKTPPNNNNHDLITNCCMRLGPLVGNFSGTFNRKANNLGYPKLVRREDVLANNSGCYLKDGTLTVYVDMKIYTDPLYYSWTPRRTLRTDFMELLETGEGSDVTFLVCDEAIQAHKILLLKRAPVLAQLVEDVPNGRELFFDDVEPSTFRTFLHFIYSDSLPAGFDIGADNSTSNALMTLIEISNRFGCVSLKLVMESKLVTAGFQTEHAPEMLLFADSHCCALLREEIMKFCVTNLSAVKASPGWIKLKESPVLLDELLGAVAARTSITAPQRVGPTTSLTEYESMPVWMLRKQLDLHNLDLDGTREMLIQRLQARSDSVSPPS